MFISDSLIFLTTWVVLGGLIHCPMLPSPRIVLTLSLFHDFCPALQVCVSSRLQPSEPGCLPGGSTTLTPSPPTRLLSSFTACAGDSLSCWPSWKHSRAPGKVVLAHLADIVILYRSSRAPNMALIQALAFLTGFGLTIPSLAWLLSLAPQAPSPVSTQPYTHYFLYTLNPITLLPYLEGIGVPPRTLHKVQAITWTPSPPEEPLPPLTHPQLLQPVIPRMPLLCCPLSPRARSRSSFRS